MYCSDTYLSLLQERTGLLLCLRPVGKGAISVALSVRPSVCPSVAYIAYSLIRQHKGLACPNLERRFPTLDATRILVSRSNGQRAGSPGPLMLTHIMRHIFRMARPSNLVYRWRTTTRISHRRHDLQGQRSMSYS